MMLIPNGRKCWINEFKTGISDKATKKHDNWHPFTPWHLCQEKLRTT